MFQLTRDAKNGKNYQLQTNLLVPFSVGRIPALTIPTRKTTKQTGTTNKQEGEIQAQEYYGIALFKKLILTYITKLARKRVSNIRI